MSITMRLAPDLDSYPRPRSLPEPDLIPTIRVEFCACGEYVRQLMGDTITDTVRRHQLSMLHRAWRLSAQDGPTAVVDVSFGASGHPVPAGATS